MARLRFIDYKMLVFHGHAMFDWPKNVFPWPGYVWLTKEMLVFHGQATFVKQKMPVFHGQATFHSNTRCQIFIQCLQLYLLATRETTVCSFPAGAWRRNESHSRTTMHNDDVTLMSVRRHVLAGVTLRKYRKRNVVRIGIRILHVLVLIDIKLNG